MPKQFTFEPSDACESFAQLIATKVPSKLSFEFAAPEEPLKLVAFE